MSEKAKMLNTKGQASFSRKIAAQEKRKLKARRESKRSAWFGLGMIGLVGWSVAVPTLLGAALGIWLDKHHDGNYSLTLMLLVIGLVIGCLNAWYWVKKEGREMHKDEEDNNE